jgi:uncharacterized protein (DUF1501 family)
MNASRRRFLAALGASAALTVWPGFTAAASGADRRLLVVLLRGAMDGLHLLPPSSDTAYAQARGALAVADARALDGSFGLHPALPFAHELYGRKQLLPVLAVAPPYRQRSHFDAQDCLENGTATPGGARDGWIGRCIDSLSAQNRGLAIAQVMPLAMRGSERAETWSPPLPRALDDALMQQLQALYAADPRLAPAFADAMQMDDVVMADAGADKGAAGPRRGFRLADAVAAAAQRMRGPEGARIAFVEDTGWDTHRGQDAALTRKFAELDAGLRAAQNGLGDDWSRTVVIVATEFGRTVAVNGSAGTDHGVGGHALLAGGAVRGGRILGDWPGLAPSQRQDGRDLRATTDLRALFKGVLADHLGVSESALETRLFPGSRAVRPLEGLIA